MAVLHRRAYWIIVGAIASALVLVFAIPPAFRDVRGHNAFH
jgi:hypothetical protein